MESAFALVSLDDWAQLDSSLCRLVDRPEYKLRLDVEFRFPNATEWTWAERPPLEEYLPQVHEKARVRVVNIWDNAVAYCSDGRKGWSS